MKGSIIASYIDEEYKKKKAYTNKKRQKCVVEGEKQCEKCVYFEICADMEGKNGKREENRQRNYI